MSTHPQISILPSPPPSSTSSLPGVGHLPHPRSIPLLPGSKKEELVRRFAEQQLMRMARRFVMKFSGPEPNADITGYVNFSEVCADFEEVIDVLWRSGTPSLQIPFLLDIARQAMEYAVAFPTCLRATFRILSKLDHCFASILCGQDVETGEPLPGIQGDSDSGRMTITEMVRCRSLVEHSRDLMATIVAGDADSDDAETDEEETEVDDRGHGNHYLGGDIDDQNDVLPAMDVTRIYKNTIDQLGQRLHDHVREV